MPSTDDAALSSSPAFRPGLLLDGKYRVERELGRGTMGIVLLATDEQLDRRVAIKVVTGSVYADLLRHEAKAMARVRHENVVHVYSFGVHEQQPFIVMEYVEGRNLDDIIVQHGYVDATAAVGILEKIAAGLNAAHEVDVVHSDVKPANVLIGPRLRVCVTDFGLAGVQRKPGVVYGTPAYLAPELLGGSVPKDTKDRALSDQYSLGVSTFEMLTGELPFRDDDIVMLFKAHAADSPPTLASRRRDIPGTFEPVIARALAKKPEDRFEDCVAFAAALRDAWQRANHRRGPRVLVVDDDPHVRALHTAILEEAFPSVQVDTAADGLVALELVRAHRPAVVVLDIEMPRLNGIDFAHALLDSNLAGVPIVVVSALVRSGRAARRGVPITQILAAFGAKEQLGKPVRPSELVAIVGKYLATGAKTA